jgi:hypothetical protein
MRGNFSQFLFVFTVVGNYLELNAMLTDTFAPEGNERTHFTDDDFTFHEAVENLQCEPYIGDGSQASDHEMPHWKPYIFEFSTAGSHFLKMRQPAGV